MINLRLPAVRRVAYEADDSGLLSPELAAGIRRVKGIGRIGVRLGNWLTADQGRCLLLKANPIVAAFPCITIDTVVAFRYSLFSSMKPKSEFPSPLSPAALQILSALVAEDLHGYGIIQAVSAQSGGSIRIGPGTLYDNLKRFLEQGWVRDLPRTSEGDKRLYRLTSAGKMALTDEIRRLEHLIRQTRPHLPYLKPRRAE